MCDVDGWKFEIQRIHQDLHVCQRISWNLFVCTWVCSSTECAQSIVASTATLYLCSDILLLQWYFTSTVEFNFYSCIVALHFYSGVPFFCSGWNVRQPNCLWSKESWQCHVEARRRSEQSWCLWKPFQTHGCEWERPCRPKCIFNFLAPAGSLCQFIAVSNQGCYFDNQQLQETQ